MSNRYLRSYANATLETASPTQLLAALYARLLRDVDDADARIQAGDAAGKGAAINHAHAIVSELCATLDHASAPELCAQLTGLYDFVLHKLVQANAHMSRAHLAEARGVVVTLKDAFDGAIATLARPMAAVGGAR